jgi:hypothetical protein
MPRRRIANGTEHRILRLVPEARGRPLSVLVEQSAHFSVKSWTPRRRPLPRLHAPNPGVGFRIDACLRLENSELHSGREQGVELAFAFERGKIVRPPDVPPSMKIWGTVVRPPAR